MKALISELTTFVGAILLVLLVALIVFQGRGHIDEAFVYMRTTYSLSRTGTCIVVLVVAMASQTALRWVEMLRGE